MKQQLKLHKVRWIEKKLEKWINHFLFISDEFSTMEITSKIDESKEEDLWEKNWIKTLFFVVEETTTDEFSSTSQKYSGKDTFN